jgi:hypothetical protein
LATSAAPVAHGAAERSAGRPVCGSRASNPVRTAGGCAWYRSFLNTWTLRERVGEHEAVTAQRRLALRPALLAHLGPARLMRLTAILLRRAAIGVQARRPNFVVADAGPQARRPAPRNLLRRSIRTQGKSSRGATENLASCGMAIAR